MSDAKKPARTNSAFSVSRRTFFGAAAAAGAATGLGGAAKAAPRRAFTEPDLVDATSNAPGYSAHPKKAKPQAAVESDPLDRALRG